MVFWKSGRNICKGECSGIIMKQRTPVITIALAAVNVLVFCAELFMGGSEDASVALKAGALYTPLVLGEHEWYRLITSMFVHFGAQHLGSNMISLLAVGPYVEAYFGKVRYLILYFAAGLGGSLLTMAAEMRTGRYALSAGASGAIFGLLSVLIIFAMTPGLRNFFPRSRVAAAVVFSLLPGLTDRSISMTAHVGGLISGFLLAFCMNRAKLNRVRKIQKREP